MKMQRGGKGKSEAVAAGLLLICLPALTQPVRFGFSVGVSASNLITGLSDRVATSGRYTVGAEVGAGLARRFGVDVDFLYKRLELGFAAQRARAAVHRWELPLMLRYQFAGLPVRPFVHAGASWNRIFAMGGAAPCVRGPFGEQFYCIGGQPLAELRHRGTVGAVLGAGIESRAGRIGLAPELRLTRWADRNFGVRGSPVESRVMQVEFLLALTF